MPVMTYEGEHEAVTLIDASGQWVEVARGDKADIAESDVHARLSDGWTGAKPVKETEPDIAAEVAETDAE